MNFQQRSLCLTTLALLLLQFAPGSLGSSGLDLDNDVEPFRNESETRDGNGRLIVLTFPLEPETCQDGPNIGSCYTRKACTNRGGTPLGTCTGSSGGTGVCCIFTLTCNAQLSINTISQNSTTLTSSGDNKDCLYNIPKLQGSCQIKVQFLTFPYDPASRMTSFCDTDFLEITGSSTVADGFKICGNTDTTIYLTYEASAQINLRFVSNMQPHTVRVTHIPCDMTLTVPENCLQQFESMTGIVTSFSYPSTLIANQTYGICVKTFNPTITTITWEECDGTEIGATASLKSQFFMSAYFASNNDTSPVNNMPITGLECATTSFVQVYGEERHCGAKFNPRTDGALVQSTGQPFGLFVKTRPDVASTYPWSRAPYHHIVFQLPGVDPVAAKTECDRLGFGDPGIGFGISTQGFNGCTNIVNSALCSCTTVHMLPDETPDPTQRRTGFCLKYVQH